MDAIYTLNRCPICFHLPVFHYNPEKDIWVGGCESRETDTCMDLQTVVLQHSIDQACAQWNAVIAPLAMTLQEVA